MLGLYRLDSSLKINNECSILRQLHLRTKEMSHLGQCLSQKQEDVSSGPQQPHES
ncbi:rCG62938 [Rattus norvegicus]|uniref:RCG62938 n=1 Tax=Rattus norvegicus TaxID=10116 RepID=A6JN71_RAT|nr:rCG62938 [Rattus norvegicus]